MIQCGLMLLLCCGAACRKADESKLEPADAVTRSSFAAAATSVEPVMPTTVARAFERSCKNCHGPTGQGIAAVAPDLRQAAARTTEQWTAYLKTQHPGATLPPPTWLNADEITAIAHYLVNLKTGGVAPTPPAEDDKAAR
jgi:mono/diheme cytochrome c family protein